MDAMIVAKDEDESDIFNLRPPAQVRDVMRVGAASPPQAVASSIQRSIFDESHLPTIRAIGAGAVAQACKGIAIARGHVAVRGLDLGVAIGFDNVAGDNGMEISAQTFRLFLR